MHTLVQEVGISLQMLLPKWYHILDYGANPDYG